MKKRVIVAGHICLDITPIFPQKRASSLGEILTPGKLLEVGKADVHTGGAVANTGLAMKLLGADVTLMGKVGDDTFGRMVADILRNFDAERELIIVKGESTSYSVVLAVPGIDRIFLHNPGANHSFRASDIPWEALEKAALFHFGYPPLMKSMYEEEGKELVTIMKRARDAGAATSLDMAAIDAETAAGRADWKEILRKVIPYVDFFVPSVEELCYMLNRKLFEKWKQSAGDRDITEFLDIEKDVKPLAEQCMELGAKVMLIKCGAPGIYYCTADRARLKEISPRVELDLESWTTKEGFEKSYIPDRIVSGTGAGDTSIAAFLTAMLEGSSLETAMHLAAAAGASCVAEYDALGGLKSLEQLQSKIDAGWKKNA